MWSIRHEAGLEAAGGRSDCLRGRHCGASFAAIDPDPRWTDPKTGYALAFVGLQSVAVVVAAIEVAVQSSFVLHRIRNRFSASFCTDLMAVKRCPKIGADFVQLKKRDRLISFILRRHNLEAVCERVLDLNTTFTVGH